MSVWACLEQRFTSHLKKQKSKSFEFIDRIMKVNRMNELTRSAVSDAARTPPATRNATLFTAICKYCMIKDGFRVSDKNVTLWLLGSQTTLSYSNIWMLRCWIVRHDFGHWMFSVSLAWLGDKNANATTKDEQKRNYCAHLIAYYEERCSS